MTRGDPILRNGIYHLRRRVPRRFESVERRAWVKISLKTDSLTDARARAEEVWREMVAGWEALLRGDTAAADEQMEAAREIAKSRGFRYLPISRVARLPVDQILQRIEAIPQRRDGSLDMTAARALLGTVEPPTFTLSKAWDEFWDMSEDRREGMSKNQLRVWKNARDLAIRTMIGAVGDLDLAAIGPDELLDYREAMWARVRAGEIQRATANKQMKIAFHIIKTVNRMRRLNLPLTFDGLLFREAERNTRLSFSDDWIRDRILAPGALDGLNTEARCILLGMVNTGYRPSEGAGLMPGDIRLDTEIPHISINAEHRKLKTKESERMIPLVGVSLEAFRQCPDGFPRYRDSAGLTATVNKYLGENGLRETPQHTMYCLRHAFEDRLLAAGVDERIRRDLMGHRLADRERYGAGAPLEHLHRLLATVVI